MGRPDRDSVLAGRAAALLADGAPRTMTAIVAELGLPPPADEYEEEDLELVLGLDDDRYAYRFAAGDYLDLTVLLDGRVFTHDPGPIEGDPVRLDAEPDLGVLLMPVARAEGIPLSGGGQARWADETPLDAIRVPAAALAAVAGGGAAGFAWQGRELTIRSVTVDEPESRRMSAEIVRLFERQEEESAELGDLLIDLLVEDDAAFRTPVAPVNRLLAEAGLSRRGDYVGRVGSGWKTPMERAESDQDALNATAYGFDECCHRAFHALGRGFLEFRVGGRPDLEELARAADHGVVAEAFVASEVSGPSFGGLAEALTGFAEALLPHGGPGAPFLRFAAHDLSDEPAAGEPYLRQALEADPDFAPALAELATLAEERGRASEAAELLRRLGVPADDPQLGRVRQALRWGRSLAGRNAPCPCGSGRKYKACCLGRELPPLAERVDWLFAKAVAFANRPAERGLLIELAEAVARGRDSERLVTALSEPLLTDVALFEEGQLERYLAVRGALLPEEERALAASWGERPRALLEVEGVTAAGELELRDTRDGERRLVPADRAGDVRPGELLLARVCAIGAAHRLVGAILPIPLRLRESLLDLIGEEPDTWDWLGWLAAVTAPPSVANMEGQPVTFCEADYRVDHPEAARRALAEAFDEAGEDGPGQVFHEMLDGDGERWIRGTLRLDGDRLTVEANSEARFAALQERVAALVPGARHLETRRAGLEEAMARAAETPRAEGPDPPPGVEEIIAEHLADYDRRWIDMQIPALGGRTPRQAADDPTRREDLLRLLDDLGRAPGSAARAARIRDALGLPGA